jgi:hypothetical protein
MEDKISMKESLCSDTREKLEIEDNLKKKHEILR